MSKWFKFYGQDWLTDAKVIRLSGEYRLCYLTLLCLRAALPEPGPVVLMDEDSLLDIAHIANDPSAEHNPYEVAQGCLAKFEQMGMITMITNDNGHLEITIKNWEKRQEQNLTGYERLKRHRNRRKTLSQANTQDDNADDNVSDNTVITLEENRREKKRIDKKKVNKEKESSEVADFLEFYNKTTNQKLKPNQKRTMWIKRRLAEGYTLEDLKTAATNFIKDDWEDRYKFLDVRYCIGIIGDKDNLERWLGTQIRGKPDELVEITDERGNVIDRIPRGKL
jgi:uncharacterized phage protein (TIGR02220 family)